MSFDPQPHQCKLFLETIRLNPGCTRQTLIAAGISASSCNVLIGRYELEQIRVKRNRKTGRVLGIWILEDAA